MIGSNIIIVTKDNTMDNNKESRITKISYPEIIDDIFKTILYTGPCKHIIIKLFLPSHDKKELLLLLIKSQTIKTETINDEAIR